MSNVTKIKTNKYDSSGWPHGPFIYWNYSLKGRKCGIRKETYYVHGVVEGYVKHYYDHGNGFVEDILGYTNGRMEGETIQIKRDKKI